MQKIEAMTAPAPGEWRDIASAPRDGTDILVCVTHSLGNLIDGSVEWETIQWVDWTKDGLGWPVFCRRVDIPFKPTHWQPLPAPPQPARSDVEEG